jgi:hypothetical protein
MYVSGGGIHDILFVFRLDFRLCVAVVICHLDVIMTCNNHDVCCFDKTDTDFIIKYSREFVYDNYK